MSGKLPYVDPRVDKEAWYAWMKQEGHDAIVLTPDEKGYYYTNSRDIEARRNAARQQQKGKQSNG